MINSLDVRNFQSLKDVHLDLGLLTVIVGDSNTGKSAVVRALKALASNLRGSSAITLGCRTASISAVCDDSKVTLEKSDTSSSYRVSKAGEPDREFTKIAGETPEEISSLLGLNPVKVVH
jgi:AAA15 family ATPase/GTPase